MPHMSCCLPHHPAATLVPCVASGRKPHATSAYLVPRTTCSQHMRLAATTMRASSKPCAQRLVPASAPSAIHLRPVLPRSSSLRFHSSRILRPLPASIPATTRPTLRPMVLPCAHHPDHVAILRTQTWPFRTMSCPTNLLPWPNPPVQPSHSNQTAHGPNHSTLGPSRCITNQTNSFWLKNQIQNFEFWIN